MLWAEEQPDIPDCESTGKGALLGGGGNRLTEHFPEPHSSHASSLLLVLL
jgi:hypothetical protein